jgi:hypothetical protein
MKTSLTAEYDTELSRMVLSLMADDAIGFRVFLVKDGGRELVRGCPGYWPAEKNSATVVYDYEVHGKVTYSAFGYFGESLSPGPWSRNVTVNTSWPAHWLLRDEEFE